MEDKYREIMEQLIYQISVDIYDLLDVDYDDIENVIIDLSRKVEKLSDDITWRDDIVYKRIDDVNLQFRLD